MNIAKTSYGSRSQRETYQTKTTESKPISSQTHSGSLVVSKPIYTNARPIFDSRLDTLSLLGYPVTSSSTQAPTLSIRGSGSTIRAHSSRVSIISSKIRTPRSYIRETSFNFRETNSNARKPISSIREPSFSIQGTKSIIRAPSSNIRKLSSSIKTLSMKDEDIQSKKKEINVSYDRKSIGSVNNDFKQIDKTKNYSKQLGANLSQQERDDIVKNIVENFNLENYIGQIKSSYVIRIELDKKNPEIRNVRDRLKKYMNSETIRINDLDYMRELNKRIDESHKVKQQKKMESLEEYERIREKKLKAILKDHLKSE